MRDEKLRPHETHQMATKMLPPHFQDRFTTVGSLDFSYAIPGLARFRVNVFHQRGTVSIAMRLVNINIPTFEQLRLPPVLQTISENDRGLVLVTGVTGSGKSTTLAAMVAEINKQANKNIITIEDPIEFLHHDEKSIINQREIGSDTSSFHEALRHILRQDPDVILVGEIRDSLTMEIALMAADTGHLVFSTLHTADATQTINRVITFFPPHQHQEIRYLLAATLQAVIAQRLIPMKDTRGRVPAVEILRSTPTVRRLIASGEFAELYDVMKRSDDLGMMTLNGSLAEMVRRGVISQGTALRASQNKDELRLNLEGMTTGIDSIDMRTEQTIDLDEDEDEGPY